MNLPIFAGCPGCTTDQLYPGSEEPSIAEDNRGGKN